jgi:PHD/YefM family antitoxin component YafN of YafNO toxin-antitoxin module
VVSDKPQYVVMTEERFQELLKAQQSAAPRSIRSSLEDVKAGHVTRYDDVDTLIQRLERDY